MVILKLGSDDYVTKIEDYVTKIYIIQMIM